MRFTLRFTKRALDDLLRLDKKITAAIISKLEFFIKLTNPLQYAKPLRGPLRGLYRFRIGDYRVIFEISNVGSIQILFILRIKHRREIYD